MGKPSQQGQDGLAPPAPARSAMISIPEHGLDELRTGFEDNIPCNKRIEKVSAELRVRSDPNRVIPGKPIELPWSREARARSKAREMSIEARLEIFKDDLRAIRIANEVLNRAETMRAVEAAEAAIFEIRCIGETARFAILNRTHLDMTRQFLDQLENIESFRGRVSNEILDALKERALNEFTARMNRASKSDVEFSKSEILKLRS
jgi:hypothetical protein